MLRFKQFRSANGHDTEEAINQWLHDAAPDVQFMTQSAGSAGEVVICFLYEEGFQATEHRLTREATAIIQQAQQDRAGEPLLEPLVVDEGQT